MRRNGGFQAPKFTQPQLDSRSWSQVAPAVQQRPAPPQPLEWSSSRHMRRARPSTRRHGGNKASNEGHFSTQLYTPALIPQCRHCYLSPTLQPCGTARPCGRGRPSAAQLRRAAPPAEQQAVLHWPSSCHKAGGRTSVERFRPGWLARLNTGLRNRSALRWASRAGTRYGIRQGATESGALKVTRGAPRVRRCRRRCPARRTAAGASPQCCSRPRQGGSGWPAPVPRPLQNGHGRSRASAAAMQQPQPLALRHRGQRLKRACCERRRRDGFTLSPQPVAPPCSQFRLSVMSSIPLPCAAPCQ